MNWLPLWIWDMLGVPVTGIALVASIVTVERMRRAPHISGVNGLTCWLHSFCAWFGVVRALDIGLFATGSVSALFALATTWTAWLNYTKRSTHWWRVDEPRHPQPRTERHDYW